MASPKKAAPASKRTQVVQAVKPWSKDAPWWILAIEAVITIGLGLYTIYVPESAGRMLTVVLGLFLLVDGAMSLFAGLRQRGGKAFNLAGSGIAILAGLLVLLMQLLHFGDAITQAWILAIAFVLVGIFGLIAAFFEFRSVRWMRVVVMLLMIVLGGLYLYSLLAGNLMVLTWTGWILLAIGVMLGIFAGLTWRQQRAAAAVAAAPAPAAAPPAKAPAAPPLVAPTAQGAGKATPVGGTPKSSPNGKNASK